MKQNMKRIWLMICMVACLFSLSACTAETQVNVDPEVEMILTNATPEVLMNIVAMSDTALEENIIAAEQQKDTASVTSLKAWQDSKDELGSLVEVISTSIAEEEHGYSCTVYAQFELRPMHFKIIVDPSDDFRILSMSFTPEYTMGERMTKAGLNTLMGMGTVFCVLIFISILIGCFKYIGVWEDKMKAKAAAAQPVVLAAPAVAPIIVEQEDLTDDLELVAVITAAIAASANTSADGLVVRSIKRVSGSKWKKA